jgi:uncharacterized membrane protein
MHALRRYLVAGLLVWVPLGVTYLVVKWLIDLMDRSLLLLPDAYAPEAIFGARIPGLGLVLTLIILLVTGMIARNLFGRSLVNVWEGILSRIPLVRSIYSAVKQLTETLFQPGGRSFNQVVMVEYPRKGAWTLAFVTGPAWAEAESHLDRELVNIYVPTTPNPTSGFFLMVPREDIIALDISVDAGLKMIISMGLVTPSTKSQVTTSRTENASGESANKTGS